MQNAFKWAQTIGPVVLKSIIVRKYGKFSTSVLKIVVSLEKFTYQKQLTYEIQLGAKEHKTCMPFASRWHRKKKTKTLKLMLKGPWYKPWFINLPCIIFAWSWCRGKIKQLLMLTFLKLQFDIQTRVVYSNRLLFGMSHEQFHNTNISTTHEEYRWYHQVDCLNWCFSVWYENNKDILCNFISYK